MPACTANNHEVGSTGSPPGGLDSGPRSLGSLSAGLPRRNKKLLCGEDPPDNGARSQDDSHRVHGAKEGRKGQHHESSEVDQG